MVLPSWAVLMGDLRMDNAPQVTIPSSGKESRNQPPEGELRDLSKRNPSIAAAITLFDVGCATWSEAMSLAALQLGGTPMQSSAPMSSVKGAFTYEDLNTLIRERAERTDSDSALIHRLAEELRCVKAQHQDLVKACAPVIEVLAREKLVSPPS